jgi:Putative auto-transporter adhesin, head GIN domain
MKKLKFVAVISVLLTLGACQIAIGNDENIIRDSENTRTESRSVRNFQKISSNLPAEINIIQGDRESLRITAEDDILAKIETKVVSGELELTFKKNENIQTTEPIEIDLELKNINGMDFFGAALVKAPKIKSDRLEINTSGASSIEIDAFQGKQLTIDLSGTGKVRLAGKVDKQEISMSGVGKYEASKLRTLDTDIDLSGAGKAIIWVERSLNIDLGGLGKVSYYGNPQVTEDVSGMGKIERLGKSPF